MLKCIYWSFFNGVFRYMLLMSIVMNFASGVFTTLLKTIFAVSRPAVSVLVSTWKSNRSPVAVIHVQLISSFWGLLLTMTRAYVAVLFVGTCALLIQNSLFVFFICWVPFVSFLLP